jgi:hypothetical protein
MSVSYGERCQAKRDLQLEANVFQSGDLYTTSLRYASIPASHRAPIEIEADYGRQHDETPHCHWQLGGYCNHAVHARFQRTGQ